MKSWTNSGRILSPDKLWTKFNFLALSPANSKLQYSIYDKVWTNVELGQCVDKSWIYYLQELLFWRVLDKLSTDFVPGQTLDKVWI